jgi:xanthine/uracil/vitamin C permease (AzgA family)
MCAVDLAAIPLMVELLGMPFEVALAVVILNGILYLTHHLLGDPVVPGWITPAIPLLIAYCSAFPEGPERVHALIAFQLMLGLFSIFIGASGLAQRVVQLIPQAIKSGVIIGAGIAAVIAVFQVGGRFDSFRSPSRLPWASPSTSSSRVTSRRLKEQVGLFGMIGKLGIFPIVALAIVVAPVFGEAPWPSIEWGFSQPDFGTLFANTLCSALAFRRC